MERHAKTLRKNLTDAERWLWQHLRNRGLSGYKFRRQHPIGPFVLDFTCIEKGVVIELDGSQHAESLDSDSRRTEYLRRKGYKVLRFWDNAVLREGEAVLNFILSSLEESSPSPHPLPRRRGRGNYISFGVGSR
jgi:very-short-patch-repair endonuclease